jgi:hypothetical protein
MIDLGLCLREIRLPRAEPGSRWAARLTGSAVGPPTCACGSGEEIDLKPRHRSKGLPRYRPGLRRYEATGLLPPIVRRDVLGGRTVRVFTARDLKRLRNALQRRARLKDQRSREPS